MKICIDAGHNYSGCDTGVSANGVNEQNITFYVANELKKVLSNNGIDVVMTRDTLYANLGLDVNSSLKERVKISNSNNCDLYISIHCNSGVANAKGTETLICGRGGQAELYANLIQEQICRDLSMVNRGVRVDTEYLKHKLYVLHNTKCPAILIELGFLTNTSDASKLINKPNEFAKAIAKGLGCAVLEKSNAEDRKELTSANDITWELNHSHFEITDINGFKAALEKSKAENSPLYWGYYKLVNK